MRLSGENSLQIAQKITQKQTFTPRYATLTQLQNRNNEPIDECIVIYFKSPHSFTGEDIVEFQCHGGISVANIILNELIYFGASIAQPGEFSKRAFLNGKIDLTKAEAIASMIESKSEDGVKLLARQMRGELQEFIEKLRDELVNILAFIEVNIDYAEEDLPKDIFDMIRNKLAHIEEQLTISYESSKRRSGLLHGFHVAIVGKPNVGKSSLLNALLNDERAITSDIAGTTRDVIEGELKLGTHLIKIIDTAGIRQTDDTIEKIGVQRSKKAIDEANIIIALFDGSRKKDQEDEKLEALLKNAGEDKTIITVLNKSDLKTLFSPLPQTYIPLSCKHSTKGIVDELMQHLNKLNRDDQVIFTSTRQINSVSEALNAIRSSKELLSLGELELFAFEIKEALTQISSITKIYDNNEMLDAMFSTFCLGK